MGLRFMGQPDKVAGLGAYVALVSICARSRHVGMIGAMVIPTLGAYATAKAWRAADDIHRMAVSVAELEGGAGA
jgi:hypothetical protein